MSTSKTAIRLVSAPLRVVDDDDELASGGEGGGGGTHHARAALAGSGRVMTKLGAIVAAALACGCVGNSVDDNALGTPDDPGTAGNDLVWRGQLFARETHGTIEGDALTATGAGERTFKASVVIRNDTPSRKRPWRVAYGTCVSGGSIVGDTGMYPLLSTDGDGEATRAAYIPVALDATAAYHVTVHFSESEMGRIIACGDLSL